MTKRPLCMVCLVLMLLMCVADRAGFPLIRGNPVPENVDSWIREHPKVTICGEVTQTTENEFSQSVYLSNTYLIYQPKKNQSKILKHKELEIFTRDAGAKIDLLNLQWIYRAKKYYNMLPPDISTLLIPIHYRIHVDQLKDLVEAPSVDEFLKLVTRTPYLRHTDTQTPASIETIYKDCLYRLYLADRRSNPYSIATVNTYLFLKEEELDKLTTVLECVRYGLPARETLTYIGGTAK